MAEICAFGDELKRAREARGVALDAVASATRIARHYLDALERSDLEALPAGPFGKGYIRAYAEYLGIDPKPILEAYGSEERDLRPRTTESDQKMLLELSRAADQRRSDTSLRALSWARPAVALFVGLAIGLALFWTWSRWTVEAPPREAEVPTLQPAAPAAAATALEREATAPGEPAPPPLAEPGGMRVSGSGLGTDVVDRRLVGRASQFPEGAQVAYWTRILEGEAGQVIHHLWFHEERLAMRAELAVGGPHWRTHSRFTLPPGATGAWRVEVRSVGGRVLDRAEFLCVEASEP